MRASDLQFPTQPGHRLRYRDKGRLPTVTFISESSLVAASRLPSHALICASSRTFGTSWGRVRRPPSKMFDRW